MMVYVLIPHSSDTCDQFRFFTSYAAMEQAVLRAAQDFERKGYNPDWCAVLGYEGQDELQAVFVYTLVGSTRLRRDSVPSPSP
jgi:hypothetical protein